MTTPTTTETAPQFAPRAIRLHDPQASTSFQSAYYDREDAAIAELRRLGAKLRDTYMARYATHDGVTHESANWQGLLRQVRELGA